MCVIGHRGRGHSLNPSFLDLSYPRGGDPRGTFSRRQIGQRGPPQVEWFIRKVFLFFVLLLLLQIQYEDCIELHILGDPPNGLISP